MRPLRILEHISLDGIIQAPGGKTEDGEYPYGGWTSAFSDDAIMDAILAAHGQSFDLILGRRTYDIWSGYWPTAPSGPFADPINAATKYVATHHPETLRWGPAQPLGPDLIAGIRAAKSKAGPHLILWGSSTLTSTLLENGLVDEVLLITYPVLLGTGKRFFSTAAPRELSLIASKRGPSGVVVNTYRPTGPLRLE